MSRILVIGAGPAGLAAGVRLLELARGNAEVHLIHMGHHLGGKAGSHRTSDGRFVEHGWHMVVGFYKHFRNLMQRAGISSSTLRTMHGKSHPFESTSGRIHTLSTASGRLSTSARFLLYDGLPWTDRSNFSRVMGEAYATALSNDDLTRYDDHCFTRWAIERGLRPHATHYSLFRTLREGYFNFPEQISAYHLLQTLKLMSTSEDAELFCVDGPYSERIWAPVARLFESLGGTRSPYTLATDFLYEGRRITGVRVARPDASQHAEGQSSFGTGAVREAAGTARALGDFDAVVSTVPHAVLATMNAADARWQHSAFFSRIRNLRAVSTLSMCVETRRPVLPFEGPVFGLPAPLGIAVNMTPYWAEYDDGRRGNVVAFVGQEPGFEGASDDALIRQTLRDWHGTPGAGDFSDDNIAHVEFHRNRADFERLMLCEPGVNRFRPWARTPFNNLFLAGDWVRNDIDVISMEGAIASGERAAEECWESLR